MDDALTVGQAERPLADDLERLGRAERDHAAAAAAHERASRETAGNDPVDDADLIATMSGRASSPCRG